MTARALMNPNPMTLDPSDTVAAADCILEHHLRHLLSIPIRMFYLQWRYL